MIYIAGTLSTLLLTYISVHIDQSKYLSYSEGRILKHIFGALSIMPLAIISAVRYNVGTDFSSYCQIYEMSHSKNAYIEQGFLSFMCILHKISDNPQIFIAVSSLIICAFYFYSIYKNSCNPVYSVLLFVIIGDYFSSMNVIRQMFAMVISLFTIPYIKSRKWLKTFIIIGIAMMIHKSAFIMIFLYFILALEWKPMTYTTALLATFASAGLLKATVLPILQRLTTYGRFFLKTSRYSKSNIDWASFLIYFSFFVLMSYKYKAIQKNKNLKLLYSAVWIALVIVASGIVMPTTVVRLALYMNPIIAIYVPELTCLTLRKSTRYVINFAIVFLYTLIRIIYLSNGWCGVLPYRTFWNY